MIIWLPEYVVACAMTGPAANAKASARLRVLRFNCCCCDRPAGKHGKHVNLVALPYRAGWEFPAQGDFFDPVGKAAVALVCDECLAEKREIPRAIEWDGKQAKATYHDVKDLMPLQEAG